MARQYEIFHGSIEILVKQNVLFLIFSGMQK